MSTDLELFSPQEVGHYERIGREIDRCANQLAAITINTPADAARLNDWLSAGKKAAKEIELYRRRQVDPLNDQVRAINAAWRPLTDSLAKFEADAKKKVVAWHQRERERVAREQAEAARREQEAATRQAEAEAAAARAKTQADRDKAVAGVEQASQELMVARTAAPADAPTGIRSEHGTSTLRETWTFRVTHPELVPRDYLMVDERKLRVAVATGVRGGIPGVEVFAEESLAVRAR